MRRTLMGAACFLFVGLAAQIASAAVIDGQFVPDSLVGSGAKYRLIFVTAGSTASTNTTKAFYDNFVETEANLSPLLNSFDYDWEAVVTVGGATPVDTAKIVLDRYASALVYNTGGVKVADDSTDLKSGALDSPVWFDQYAGYAGSKLVWTGDLDVRLSPYPTDGSWLGTPPDGTSMVGLSYTNDGTWLKAFPMPQSISGTPVGLAVYGISKELTAIPEPATAVLWSLCAGVAGLVYWRKRH
jgi:hypothetical protein